MALRNAFADLAIEVTQSAIKNLLGERYAGGKSSHFQYVSAPGDTNLVVPGAGQAVTVYWASAISNPGETETPLIKIGFDGAGDWLYGSYAMAHWEVFTGDPDQPLIVNLDGPGNVAVTVHYTLA